MVATIHAHGWDWLAIVWLWFSGVLFGLGLTANWWGRR